MSLRDIDGIKPAVNSLYPMPRPVIGCAASAAAYIALISSSDRCALPRPFFELVLKCSVMAGSPTSRARGPRSTHRESGAMSAALGRRIRLKLGQVQDRQRRPASRISRGQARDGDLVAHKLRM